MSTKFVKHFFNMLITFCKGGVRNDHQTYCKKHIVSKVPLFVSVISMEFKRLNVCSYFRCECYHMINKEAEYFYNRLLFLW